MKTDQTTTTTTVTTTTRRRKIPAPKPQRRLAKRVRTVTVRTAVVKLPKAMLRRIADSARTVKRAEVISVTTTRALPAPTKPVSALTVKERRRLPDPR
jgi:hypothetical protein